MDRGSWIVDRGSWVVGRVCLKIKIYIYIFMLFAGWEVRIVKNCDRGLENAARGRRPRATFSRPR